ncbi:MAG: 50S ribosomal protein L4 [bacterium]|nr:50S ribosomal protein L4 [bacterium]
MAKEISVLNLEGEKIGAEQIEIPDFKPNMDVIHRYVVAFLSGQRQGTSSTKTRAEVSGSGRKPWRQKGTGRARVGSIRTPIWRHGGVVFGPKPRDYRKDIPEKMKDIALRDTLRTLISNDGLVLVDIADGIKNVKTRVFANFLEKAGLSESKVLVLIDKNFADREKLIRCIRNIENISYCYAEQINPYLLLTHDKLVAQKNVFQFLKNISSSGESNV